jgi:type I restriction enzyme S subunit
MDNHTEPIYGELPKGWRLTSIGELVASGSASLQTGPFGTMLQASEYRPVGTPVIAVKDIGDNRLLHGEVVRIADSTVQRLSRYLVRTGDIVFGRKGDVRCRAFIHPDEDGWLQGSDCIRLRLQSEFDPRFVSFVLGSRAFGEWIARHAGGATMPSLNQEILYRAPLPRAPLCEQKAISSLLSAMDDKIELNWRMNRTLEELAAVLFRSWFVDFDPVVAKAARRQPAHLHPDLSALFPATFQDSPLGPIPHGWEVKPIGDVVKVVGGSTPSTNEPKFWNGNIAWATPRDLAALSDPVLITTERQITAAGLEQISSGLLPKGSVLLSSRAPIGYTAIADIPVGVNQGFIALLCDGPLPNYYVIEWVRENMETIKGNANGTTFMEISKKNFRPITAIVPPPAVVAKFMEIVSPWWRQIIHNVRESRTLAAMRDMLLPKLLSGELRVKSAEKLVEAK